MPKSLVTIRPRRPQPVFVCKKCLTRVPDGAKLRRSLKSELKQHASAQGTKSPRVVQTSCLGICPKRAVVVANAATLRHGDYLLLTDRDGIADAVKALSPGA